ncbi:hypothetical protein BST11_01145 [Mycobacterium alsense]|uniref:Transmembrane protein n=1 Tax=Mycobacterium alsense TaxID=324058 RepID=A0AA42BYD0_9MYCO|nr:hypothetical protein [Mycobacterium alsense]MCV7378612.1 hypothetical protein [Mycobacterium alsense]OQZ93935.1 hypothetical protein BST11_01145 [Mycobacterium alsense]
MTGPHSDTTEQEASGRPISVAELLARNGTIGAPAVTRRRRRRRGDSDAVTVAELTGEIPVVRDPSDQATDQTAEHDADAGVQVAEPVPEPETVPGEVAEEPGKTPYWSEPEPRWPKSPPPPRGLTGPERSAYPRPLPHTEVPAERGGQSGAEDMSPDPLDHYADIPVDVMDSEVRDAEPAAEDSAYVRSYLGPDSTLFGGQTLADEVARRRGGSSADSLTAEDVEVGDDLDTEAEERRAAPGRFESLWRGSLIVFQSILAVAFGAGLFVAFDELWRWNSIVALVLSVLVILGLVVGVRVVRKTEDIASTLIAVAVGALITLGPLVLSLQSG